jgi:transcriptional regulator with XRE-family HTH domain
MNLKKNPIKQDSTNIIGKNITTLLNSYQITEYDLAKILNIPYNTINRIITGVTTDPRISTLEQISQYFGVTLDFLLNKNSSQIREVGLKIPVISWDLLSDPDFLKKIDRDNWEKWISAAQLLDKFNTSEKTFAIQSTKSMQPRFPSGTTFIVNYSEIPVDGDLILVRFKTDNSVSLRELIIDSPNWQLHPVVTGSQGLLFNHLNHAIVGVVILTLIQTRII